MEGRAEKIGGGGTINKASPRNVHERGGGWGDRETVVIFSSDI